FAWRPPTTRPAGAGGQPPRRGEVFHDMEDPRRPQRRVERRTRVVLSQRHRTRRAAAHRIYVREAPLCDDDRSRKVASPSAADARRLRNWLRPLREVLRGRRSAAPDRIARDGARTRLPSLQTTHRRHRRATYLVQDVRTLEEQDSRTMAP